MTMLDSRSGSDNAPQPQSSGPEDSFEEDIPF